MTPRLPSIAIAISLAFGPMPAQTPAPGYYRYPTLTGDAIVFTAEGDLWKVPVSGGTAQRLTSNLSEESHAAASPDGRTIAFSAAYEGPTEVYTMPIDGGPPVRHTFEGGTATVVGWTPEGKILYATRHYSTLPSTQLATVDPRTNVVALVQLAQAADGDFDAHGTLFFTRFSFQGSFTKRYQGGTAQNIWRYEPAAAAAVPLTASYAGTSRSPMLWNGRVYFVSDRDGSMNLWSMDQNGHDLKQQTKHSGFDVQSPSLRNGKIVYQLGADLRVYDIASGSDAPVSIRLVSDFEQTRTKKVDNPASWISDAHLSPTGDRVVITARGQVFVAPVKQGRFVDASRDPAVRYREAKFFPDGKTLLTLSDKSGEVEFWRNPANGIGATTQLTDSAKTLRLDGIPSPDGRYIANTDKAQQLWIFDTQTKTQTLLGANREGDFTDIAWSPDGRWLAYSAPVANLMNCVFLYSTDTKQSTPVTSDRYDSWSPAWSPDGKWLFLLSDRNFVSQVTGTWGSREPEPYFDKQTLIYAIALVPGVRSPFQADDELGKPAEAARPARPDTSGAASRAGGVAPEPPTPIDLTGIETRLIELPVPAGNYEHLATDGKRLYYIARDASTHQSTLRTFAIDNKGSPAEPFLADADSYELSADRNKVMVQRGNDILVFDAGARAPADMSKSQVSFKDWDLFVNPRDEWRQEFVDAWRLERDFFYDRGMNGVDWPAVRVRYAPLVERVTDRAELSDLLSQMVGELSALHIFVRGGDVRRAPDPVLPASLGARLVRDSAAGGYLVDHIYETDPDAPRDLAPLARYGVDVRNGDIVQSVNGVSTLSVPDIGQLLRDQAGRQVLLTVQPKAGGSTRQVIVTPITQATETQLRYAEWEYTRRLAVEAEGKGQIGYVHLRAMDTADIAQWERDFYPVFNRAGLIIDVRHNNGGNIDSWILEKLLRKAWFFWQPRTGDPLWNMQYAFRGQVVVLTDEYTSSDGEAFSEGFRRLGLGKLIGTRTWGGEIWLSNDNPLVDRGIATAAELGVYGPEGKWLIEGHGVDPDVVVDNEPHATFLGGDAQLDAAIKYLQGEIATHPAPVPAAPPYPNKSLKGGGTSAGGGAPSTPAKPPAKPPA